MSRQTKSLKRMLLKEAEGALELCCTLDDRWPLDAESRELLTQRCLSTLDEIIDPRGHRAQINYLRGQALRLEERFAEAIEALEESWHLESLNVHTCLALGWCYKRVGRLEDAIEAMQLGLNVEPRRAILHYNLACYYALLKKTRPAVKHLTAAVTIDRSLHRLIASEKDFDPIRERPSFAGLVHQFE